MGKILSERFNKYFYLSRSYLKFLLTGKALAFPLTIQIQTQSQCNGNCIFCPYPNVHKQLAQGIMDRDTFEKIVNELAATKYHPHLLFELHNEPLLDTRIFEFIGHAKKRLPGIICSLVTNGQLLDKFTLQEIKESNVDRIIVSLNAYSSEMYRKISGGIDFDRIINNISKLISDESLKQKITISFVITSENIEEMSRAIRYWRNLGVKTRTIDLYNRAGSVTNYQSLKLKNKTTNLSLLKKTGKYLIARTIDITGCYDLLYHTSILFNGDVITCCDDWKRESVIGNIKEKSIKEIWNSPSLNKIRKLILKKKYAEIPPCKNCSKAI
ncbi:MAG: SPASM domain-containing protein [Dehalococcoidales bacterium]|nr:SPASM domain-containing protein [Dehalococcoidales bacterium]